MNIQQLANHMYVSSLPKRLGGSSDISHAVWVSQCLQSIWHKSSIDDDDIVAYVAPIVARPSPADAARHSISSASPSDTDALNPLSPFNPRFDLGWDSPPTSSSVDPNSPFWLSRNCSVEPSSAVSRETTGSSSSPAAAVILLSPPPPKRRLSSDSVGESVHRPDSGGLTINEVVDYVRDKGQHGLMKEYKLLKEEDPAGTFEVSKYDITITSLCETLLLYVNGKCAGYWNFKCTEVIFMIGH